MIDEEAHKKVIRKEIYFKGTVILRRFITMQLTDIFCS